MLVHRLHVKGMSRPVCADPQMLDRVKWLSKKIKLNKHRTQWRAVRWIYFTNIVCILCFYSWCFRSLCHTEALIIVSFVFRWWCKISDQLVKRSDLLPDLYSGEKYSLWVLVLFHSIPLYTFTPQYFTGKYTLLQLLFGCFTIRFQLKTPDRLWKYDVSQIKVDKGALKSDPPGLLDIKVLLTCWILWALFYCGICKWCEHFFHLCIYAKTTK